MIKVRRLWPRAILDANGYDVTPGCGPHRVGESGGKGSAAHEGHERGTNPAGDGDAGGTARQE